MAVVIIDNVCIHGHHFNSFILDGCMGNSTGEHTHTSSLLSGSVGLLYSYLIQPPPGP